MLPEGDYKKEDTGRSWMCLKELDDNFKFKVLLDGNTLVQSTSLDRGMNGSSRILDEDVFQEG